MCRSPETKGCSSRICKWPSESPSAKGEKKKKKSPGLMSPAAVRVLLLRLLEVDVDGGIGIGLPAFQSLREHGRVDVDLTLALCFLRIRGGVMWFMPSQQLTSQRAHESQGWSAGRVFRPVRLSAASRVQTDHGVQTWTGAGEIYTFWSARKGEPRRPRSQHGQPQHVSNSTSPFPSTDGSSAIQGLAEGGKGPCVTIVSFLSGGRVSQSAVASNREESGMLSLRGLFSASTRASSNADGLALMWRSCVLPPRRRLP
ncbi:hypothetical protein KC323_g256 [Hortaea werneckii]|nr:hypothetical protein KC323_g256 [Hortaea werneckii]